MRKKNSSGRFLGAIKNATCRNHLDIPAEVECAGCHQPFCLNCVEEITGQYYCKLCQSRLKADNVGFVEKMKATLRHSREEALIAHLKGLGVEANLIQYETGSSMGKMQDMVKLVDQDVDGIWVEDLSKYSEYLRTSEYHLHFVVYSRLGYKFADLANDLKARSKKLKRFLLWGKVSDIKWVGGPIVQSLNTDPELSQLILKGEQLDIKINPDPLKYNVDILNMADKLRPSRESFIAFNRIAKHIRNYLASYESVQSS